MAFLESCVRFRNFTVLGAVLSATSFGYVAIHFFIHFLTLCNLFALLYRRVVFRFYCIFGIAYFMLVSVFGIAYFLPLLLKFIHWVIVTIG